MGQFTARAARPSDGERSAAAGAGSRLSRSRHILLSATGSTAYSLQPPSRNKPRRTPLRAHRRSAIGFFCVRHRHHNTSTVEIGPAMHIHSGSVRRAIRHSAKTLHQHTSLGVLRELVC